MKNSYVAFAALLTLSASSALAYDDVACWNRDVEQIDYMINPPEKGDNHFFTVAAATSSNTNVTLVYPASASLKEFTQRLYKIRTGARTPLLATDRVGCDYAYFNNMTYFMPVDVAAPAGKPAYQGTYKPTTVYPDPGAEYATRGSLTDGLTNGKVYLYTEWPANGGGTPRDLTAACAAANANAARQADCAVCIASRGYWLNPDVADNDVSAKAGVFRTNFLRFHPPKWLMLALAYKRLVMGPLLRPLREAVTAPYILKSGGASSTAVADAIGARTIQMMLPQSCNGSGRPLQQKITAIDDLAYTNPAKPIGEMLLNTAWYMGGQQPYTAWHYNDRDIVPDGTHANAYSGKSGPCNGCAGDFMVLFSDGRSDIANPRCTVISGMKDAFCTTNAQCATAGIGEGDGDQFLNDSSLAGLGKITGAAANTPSGTCANDFADDVARWVSETPMSTESGYEKSVVKTYVVGIGDPFNTYGGMTILNEIAKAGKTNKALIADDFKNLEANIEKVLMSIIENATSFSSASISSVQTRGLTSAFVPRFLPADGQLWSGSLSRFDLFNEFSAGCTSADHGKLNNTKNPNADSSCYDFYIRDKDGKFVGESDKGAFVELNSSVTWDGGWPPKRTADGGYFPVEPIWEAAEQLSNRMDAVVAAEDGGVVYDRAGAKVDPKKRRIYTAALKTYGGTPDLIEFKEENAALLAPMLGIRSATGETCTTFSILTRNNYNTAEECARDLIRFVHGHDVLLTHPENRVVPRPAIMRARPNVLGDIFHSTPVLVTRPVETFLCDLGIVNQCVASLYDETLTPGGKASYAQYFADNATRRQFILVGANDGMLHAFGAGDWKTSGGSADAGSYDYGTGEELWAFIPPDLLPKLIRLATGDRHELFVDGSPMVRDVWVDGIGSTPTADGVKDADEYRTVAVVGERQGGRSFFALDVTDSDNPKFLWNWPPPGTVEHLYAGESWNDLGPAAPAIGPIAESVTVGDGETAPLKDLSARERYVVALGGGYDPAFIRGRSINILDVWTGKPVYRFTREQGAATTDPAYHLWPVAAPVTMLDTNADGLFDAAIVGDIGGQMWTVNMEKPGQLKDGVYENWFTARAFTQFKGEAFSKRSPFFQRAVAAQLSSGEIRVFVGAGDRAQIKDPNGGTCGLANIGACIRKGCTVKTTTNRYKIGSGPMASGGGRFTDIDWTGTPASTATQSTLAAGGTCSDVADVELQFDINCGAVENTATYLSSAYCDFGATVSSQRCPVGTGRPLETELEKTVTVDFSRFYAFRLFDTTRTRFTTYLEAKAYDAAALTDKDLGDMTLAGKPNITPVPAATEHGWLVEHQYSQDERTASSALLLGGCLLWNTLAANTTPTTSACGSPPPADLAYIYQSDAVTGAIQCGTAGSATMLATTRSTGRTTYIAPQQPTPVISVNESTQEIVYSGVSLEPGRAPISVQIGASDVVGAIHWLEVPREVHECRHNGTCN